MVLYFQNHLVNWMVFVAFISLQGQLFKGFLIEIIRITSLIILIIFADGYKLNILQIKVSLVKDINMIVEES